MCVRDHSWYRHWFIQKQIRLVPFKNRREHQQAYSLRAMRSFSCLCGFLDTRGSGRERGRMFQQKGQRQMELARANNYLSGSRSRFTDAADGDVHCEQASQKVLQEHENTAHKNKKSWVAPYYGCSRSPVLRSLSPYTCGHKTKDSHHRSPGGERRRQRKRSTVFLEGTLENGPSTIRPMLELFQRQHWGTPGRRGRAHIYGLSRAHRYHLELN